MILSDPTRDRSRLALSLKGAEKLMSYHNVSIPVSVESRTGPIYCAKVLKIIEMIVELIPCFGNLCPWRYKLSVDFGENNLCMRELLKGSVSGMSVSCYGTHISQRRS